MLDILLTDFYKDFAATSAEVVLKKGDVGLLYRIATGNTPPMSRAEKEKAVFRAAYILEYIYFNHYDCFAPYKDDFIADFPKTTNASAKRHFTKIMTAILQREKPDQASCRAIAEAAASWIIEPKTRVAVKLGAIEVLLLLKEEVEWVAELLPAVIETVSSEASPAIIARLKRWKTGK